MNKPGEFRGKTYVENEVKEFPKSLGMRLVSVSEGDVVSDDTPIGAPFDPSSVKKGDNLKKIKNDELESVCDFLKIDHSDVSKKDEYIELIEKKWNEGGENA